MALNVPFDVAGEHLSSDEVVGGYIAPHLKCKGFCVLAPGLIDSSCLAKARAEAKDLDFREVSAPVADGLLGPEGSAVVADLESGLEDEARTEGPALVSIDQRLSRLWAALCPYTGYLGVEMTVRSDAAVHRSGAAPDDPPELTEQQVIQWQGQFLRHTIMLIASLGPKTGILELRPLGASDAEPTEVHTVPGSVVLLRPDLLSHRHVSPSGEALALSCFLLAGACKKGLPVNIDASPLIPAAVEMEEWTISRMQELKDQEAEEGFIGWEHEIPRSWQSVMNHTFHRGQITGIGSDACLFPCSSDPESFFLGSVGGVDYATQVPSMRWDHESYFWDPSPDSYLSHKTSCRHGCFAEGIELFDNKFFNLSIFESKQLDPHSRTLLEVGYECLSNMGYQKKHLMNAAGGVYVGCMSNEWIYVGGLVPQGGSSGILCFHSGRISFCLGMKGPALSITTEAASGLVAALMASDSVQKKGTAVGTDFAIGIASHLLLSPVWWSNESMAGRMSNTGRCLTFDAGADGYIRGDATCGIGVKNASDIVDGEILKTETDDFLGTVAGGKMSTSGKTASMTAPNSPAEQQVVADAVRNASLAHADIDGVEAHGDAVFVGDAVEVSALWRAHRMDGSQERLQLGSIKTSIGNQVECSGLTSIIKVLRAARWGHQVPNIHLRQINPHIDCFENPLDVLSENLEFAFRSTFNGVKSRGMGGTNAYLITWGTMASEQHPAPERAILPLQRCPVPTFWPGGGGELEDAKRPRKRDGYYIAGTWSRWTEPQRMMSRGSGVYTFDVVLGENRWEKFQIWLDGEDDRALHPGELNAPRGSGVLGPGGAGLGAAAAWAASAAAEEADEAETEARAQPEDLGDEAFEFPLAASGDPRAPAWLIDGRPWEGNLDAGEPGDAYRVRFQVAGRWRLVSWDKATPASSSTRPALAAEAGEGMLDLAVSPTMPSTASYFVAGGWSGWELEEMQPVHGGDTSAPGSFVLDLRLPSLALSGSFEQPGEFVIVRDGDWSQVLHPWEPTDDGSGGQEVCGPDPDDDAAGGLWAAEAPCWRLRGVAGDRFRIEFRRATERGQDVRRLTWQKLHADALAP